MCRLPLDELLEGSAPTLSRTLTTGTLVKAHATQSRRDASEVHLAACVGRELQREFESSARDGLHCRLCDDWLRAPVTLRCGHSICGAHVGHEPTRCPTCGLSDESPCRDFFLQECTEHFSAESNQRSKVAKLAMKRARPYISARRAKGVRGSARARSSSTCLPNPGYDQACSPDGVHCSICLETFPGPRRAPAILRCGHALCTTCVAHVQSRGKVGQRCPLCKTETGGTTRPSHALRSALRFYNALPVVRQAQGLGYSLQDLHACHARVKNHRIEYAAAQAAPLHDAIRRGDELSMRALLKEGADCNTLVLGFSALHVAIQCGRFDMISCLLLHGADPTVKSASSSETPVSLASASDNGSMKTNPARVEAVRLMLQSVTPDTGRSVVLAGNASGATALLHVCRRLVQTEACLFSGDSFDRELELAQFLLSLGADVQARNVFGESPAVLLEQLSSVKGVLCRTELLSSHVDV